MPAPAEDSFWEVVWSAMRGEGTPEGPWFELSAEEASCYVTAQMANLYVSPIGERRKGTALSSLSGLLEELASGAVTGLGVYPNGRTEPLRSTSLAG